MYVASAPAPAPATAPAPAAAAAAAASSGEIRRNMSRLEGLCHRERVFETEQAAARDKRNRSSGLSSVSSTNGRRACLGLCLFFVGLFVLITELSGTALQQQCWQQATIQAACLLLSAAVL